MTPCPLDRPKLTDANMDASQTVNKNMEQAGARPCELLLHIEQIHQGSTGAQPPADSTDRSVSHRTDGPM
ncbi:unnamed protein product [Pleuronectes platessa]|uniref:Uncharacterized protein n=1 Tax=Pleuronectes platessa TaxID=8262 RepID=A0A9N7ZCJ8_PLEPL|nr:unnamed protein product [Pleuronectes platessa]